GPETAITKAISAEREAARGPSHPPWLKPQTPMHLASISLSDFRYLIAASPSSERSINGTLRKSPLDSPTPRLSYARAAKPSDANHRALKRSLFCGPEPWKRTTAGYGAGCG